jgi:Kinesin motor domain
MFMQGKTYTIGGLHDSRIDRGLGTVAFARVILLPHLSILISMCIHTNLLDTYVVMRSATYIFDKASRMADSISVRLSILEIYNETLIDLLRDPVPSLVTPATIMPPKLTIAETVNGVVIPAMYVLPVSNEDDVYAMYLDSCSNRMVSEHQLNRKSSRSHVIYTFYITRTRSEDDIVQSVSE